jgi:16S rRNA (guanine527-N7)-methyltransferase
MLVQDFIKYTSDNNLQLSDQQLNQLHRYQELLKEKNEVMNLTGIVEKEEVFEKHFLDSILFSFDEDLDGKKCIDVGTGAGFPGLVLAICYPKLHMVLLEPLTKRCSFLSEVVETLKLENVVIVNQRSEDFCKTNKEQFDYAFARAVSKLNILVEIISPLLKVNGVFVALKGKIYQEEINQSKNAFKELNLEVSKVKEGKLPSENDIRGNIFIKKINRTPNKYPRNYGQIKKRPL